METNTQGVKTKQRGGKRPGAGNKPVLNPLKVWAIRVHEHEKELVKEFLKSIRK